MSALKSSTLSHLAALLLAGSASAQDNLGLAGSTSAPVNTVFMNPSSIVDSRAWMDIQLAGMSAFVHNNLAYYDQASGLLGNPEAMGLPGYNRGAATYRAYADAEVVGPGISMAFRGHSFAITSRLRTVADARGLPQSLGYYITEGFQYREQMGVEQQVRDARLGGLSWLETGVSYGTIISRSGGMITQAGISVRRLTGIMGAGMRIDDWTYTVLDSSNMETTRFSGEYGFNDPGFEQPSWNNGSGWGVDLGITFKQRLSESSDYVPHSPCTDGDYRYRLGFSVLDVGAVRFRGPFYRNIFDQTERTQWNDFSNTTAEDAADLDSLLNHGFGAAQDNSDGQRFVMMLPTALSAQFDYNFGHGLYVHAILTGGVPWRNRLGVQRASYLGVIPRWERRHLEVALPMSLHEFSHFQAGMMVRLHSFFIGSDNLLWLVGQRMYGADLYLGLKITLFRHWKCREPREKPERGNREEKGRSIPCPGW